MNKSLSCLSAIMFAVVAQSVSAGEPPPPPGKAPLPPPPAPEPPFVTGFLSLAYETHFISYGQDVWAIGNDWGEWFFHPTLELDFNLGNGWQAYLNTWMDVNDQAVSDIAKNVQEVDVNVGVYYTHEKWKFQLGYGAWMYAEQTEHIIDGKISYNDGTWNPFLMLHGRVADDISFDTGLVGQIGIAPSKTFGTVTLSLPVTVSFDTDNFHGGEGGFAYASIGLGAGIPLCKHTTLNASATFYHTDDDVIPGNPDEDFFFGSAGITIAF